MSSGSSISAVPVPTTTASTSERSACTSARDFSPEIQRLVPSGAAMRPSSVEAYFHVTNGRPVRTACSQTLVDRLGLGGQHARLDDDAGRAQDVRAAAGLGGRVVDGVDDARDARVDDRLGARPGPAGVGAGFEGHDDRAAARAFAGALQGDHLGVRAAGDLVVAAGDEPARRRRGRRRRRPGWDWSAEAAARRDRSPRAWRALRWRWASLRPPPGRSGRDARLRVRVLGPRGVYARRQHTLRARQVRRGEPARGDAWASPPRAASHPDSHRRSRSCTGSTDRWLRSGRGLSPPVRNCTDPGARKLCLWPKSPTGDIRRHQGADVSGCQRIRRPVSGCGPTTTSRWRTRRRRGGPRRQRWGRPCRRPRSRRRTRRPRPRRTARCCRS